MSRAGRTLPILVAAALLPGGALGSAPRGPGGAASGEREERRPAAASLLASLPLAFEENRGQADPAFAFVVRARGAVALLAAGEAEVRSPGPSPARFRMRIAGARPGARLEGRERLRATANHFRGNRPDAWVRGAPLFRGATAEEVLPGARIDWRGDGERDLRFDLRLAPGSDPAAVVLEFPGAEAPAVDGGGDLVVPSAAGCLRLSRPRAWQEAAGGRVPVTCTFAALPGGRAGFRTGPLDASLPLVIDPILQVATYLGGNSTDSAGGVAVGPDGSVVVAGFSVSLDYPIKDALQPDRNSVYEAVVTKIDPAVPEVVWSTYLGGAKDDYGLGAGVDAAGDVVVAGYTRSTDFPTVAPLQPAAAGAEEIFVSCIVPDGTALQWSTYLGGAGNDRAEAIAVTPAGAVLVTGFTTSTDFPTASPVFPAYGGGVLDAYALRIAPGGGSLDWSTYLGGSDTDRAAGIAVAPDGSCAVVGTTTSPDFPQVNPVQAGRGGLDDFFVAKFAPSGTSLVFSTWLGGPNFDEGKGVAMDSSGAVFVAGNAQSGDLPVVRGLPKQAHKGAIADAYAAKIDPDGSSLDWSTYLGGSSGSLGNGIAVDAAGGAVVAGLAYGPGLPTRFFRIGPTLAGAYDAFAARIAPDGSRLEFGLLFGGSGPDSASAIASAPDGTAWILGSTASSDFPLHREIQGVFGGGEDMFLARVGAEGFFVRVRRGSLTDRSAAGKDAFRAKGVAGVFVGDGTFHEDTMDLVVRAGPEAAPSVLTVPAGDPGWRRRRSVLSWKSPRGASPRWRFRLDEGKRTFAVSARGLDFESPAGNPILLGLGNGIDEGTDLRPWKAARRLPKGTVASFGIR